MAFSSGAGEPLYRQGNRIVAGEKTEPWGPSNGLFEVDAQKSIAIVKMLWHTSGLRL
jgi:hypothetical protein